jgi:CDP-diacylglycerol--serine O-phosphatidyltransferase
MRAAALLMNPALGLEGARNAFDLAARLLGWAVLLDGFDGRIARLTNSTSEFGREFDSLADVIAFGVAPAVLAFSWGVRPIEPVFNGAFNEHLRDFGLIVSFGFVICGAARLARFNIQSSRPATDKRHFVGLPIPAAAGVIAAIVHWAKYPINDWMYGLAWIVIVGVLGFLMVSTVRYFSLKAIDLRKPRPFFGIILIGLVIYGIWQWSEPVLFTLAVVYAISGPTTRLISRIRPRQPAPKEVHAS